MRRISLIFVCLLTLGLWSVSVPAQAPVAVSYDIVYVRAPRPGGDAKPSKIQEVVNPMGLEPGTDLMLLHPNGTEDVLVAGGAKGAVTDPCVSFDGQWIYYSYFPNVVDLSLVVNPAVPITGADIFKMRVATRQVIQLTHGEYTPSAFGPVKLPYGVFNMGPCPVATPLGDKVVFTSNRNGFEPPKALSPVTSQLYVMNEDGSDVEAIAPMTLGAALHPFQLRDGRIAFSTAESQGLRDYRLWAYWTIWPDGRVWEPLWSGFTGDVALHWGSQLSGGDVVLTGYYNLNNAGFGSFLRFPAQSPTAPIGFGSPIAALNAPFTQTSPYGFGRELARWPFMPIGAMSPTPWSHMQDNPAVKDASGTYVGKVTQPSGAPNGDLLLVYTPGPANWRGAFVPAYDAGLSLMRDGVSESPADLVTLKNDPRYNEQQPRAVVPYSAIYGVTAPKALPFNANDGSVHASLPAGAPYGIIGTSSLYKRESAPGGRAISGNYDGLDCFNCSLDMASSNWVWQGSDDGKYTNDDIAAIRIVTMEPHGRPPAGAPRYWVPLTNERLRVLGEIPVRKPGVIDPDGNPDTSFWAKVPADTPFTFQMLDGAGRMLSMAQTWHQVRPGEVRVDCGGCHSHSQAPLAFATTAAAKLPPVDLTLQPAHDVEFIRDVRPILQAKCVSCHQGSSAPTGLRFDLTATVVADNLTLPRDYAALARNTSGLLGGAAPPAGAPLGKFNPPNVSRYVRVYQSRRSLLAWKISGARLDGWTNASWTTDLDYDDTANHATFLTDAERRTLVTWIDLAAPIDLGCYFCDETRPALTAVAKDGALLVGAADAYSGVNAASLAVTVNGAAVTLTALGDGRWTAPLPAGASVVSASVKDTAGNLTTRVTSSAPPPSSTLPAPTNLRFEPGAIISSAPTLTGFPIVKYPRVLWDAVPGAAAYEATMTWSSGRIVAQMPVVGLNGFPLPLGQPGHQYRVSVRACAVLPPAPCDGAVASMVVER